MMKKLAQLVEEFLADLAQQNRSKHTQPAYSSDLAQFLAFYAGSAKGITPDVLRRFGATQTHLSPASRARKESSLANFLLWAYRRDYVATNPMLKVDRVHWAPRRPRGLSREKWRPSWASFRRASGPML